MAFRTSFILAVLLCSFSVITSADEINMNPGLWEWHTSLEIPGSRDKLPPTSNRKCLTKDDLVPAMKKPGQKCDVKDLKKNPEKVTWAMTCTSPKGPIASVGEMFYNGDSAHGSVRINTQGMFITSKMKGKRLGACK